MFRNPAISTPGLVCCLFALSIHANEITADPVIVTATRTAQSADETLASVTVISRKDIEKSGARDLADILRMHAGLDIGRNGGPGQTTSLFLRGTESNHTLILLDGVRINPGTIGGAPIQNINPEIIERIEIVRGPHSTLYGSDAIGGVVQIFTRRTKKDFEGNAYLGGGTDSTRLIGGSLQGAKDNLRAGISIDSEKMDGFPTRTTSSNDRGFDNLTANAYIGMDSGIWDMELSHWQAEGNSEYLDFFLAPVDQDFENSVTTLTVHATPSGIWSPTLKLSHMEDEIQQQQGSDFVRTKRNILDWQNDFSPNDEHLITAGLYLLREDTDSLSFGTGFDEDTDVDAVFAQDNMRFGDNQLLVSARYTDREGFGDHTTWSIAYGHRFNPATRMFASVGTAFRAPDATDRFGFGGNPNLEPETSRNFEIGIQKNIGARQDVKVTVFQNTVDDLITFNDPDGFLGPIPGMNENVEEARIRGIEFHYGLSMGKLSAQVEAIIQNPENRDTGVQLARRAKRTLTTHLDYDFDQFTAGLEWLVTSERKDSDFSNTINAGYGLMNLNVNAPMTRDISVRSKIENLLDKDYALADGFQTQDRAFYITLRYQPRGE